MAIKYDCVSCRKQVTATRNNRYRSHSNGDGDPCDMSAVEIPDFVLAQPVGKDDAPDVPREGIDFAVCPQCERKVKLTRMGYFEPHNATLNGGDRCEVSGVRAKHARKTEDVPLPGDEKPKPGAAIPEVKDSARPVANRGLAITSPAPGSTSAGADSSPTEPPPMSGPTERPVHELNLERQPMAPSPESTSTSPPWEQWTEGSDSFWIDSDHLILMDAVIQPELEVFDNLLFTGTAGKMTPPVLEMSERGKELAARLRETFYAYTNRNSSDNRSAQKTLGPSEAGSPCERQIAMKLLGITPVNPQEGWAPFVGTAVHRDLAEMFEWANGQGSGRYVTEMRVQLDNPFVPGGTLDLLDRVLYMVDDHKLMGRWSLDQLRRYGPSMTYRKQIQIYGLGAERAGEKVREVAIIGWPRQESSLDNLFVHVEKYDRKIAEAALDRVAGIAARVKGFETDRATWAGLDTQAHQLAIAREFPAADDCKWCPFNLPKDKGFTRGCPGK